MERNRKLFYQIADIIETYPERHDQNSWIENPVGEVPDSSIIYDGEEISCGTNQCIAGWAVIIENGGLTGLDEDEVFHFNNGNELPLASVYDDIDTVPSIAKTILGLNDDEASNLFYTTEICDHELFDMPRVLREIGDGAAVSVSLRDAHDRNSDPWLDESEDLG